MTIQALVPVKALSDAKTRLSIMLSREERAELTLRMLRQVLGSLRASGVLDSVAVVTPDPLVARFAQEAGAGCLPERGEGLNGALEAAMRAVVVEEQAACLTVFGDLPLLTPDDIAAIVRAAQGAHSCVLAPDRHERGTNAVLWRPGREMPFRVGEASFSAYVEAARAAHVACSVYRSVGTGLDVDTPEDLRELWSQEGALGLVADRAAGPA